MKPASSSKDQELLKLLKELESLQAEYPADLQAARRDAFLAQVEQYGPVESEKELSPADQKVIGLLERLRAFRTKYPPKLWAARRATYQRQIIWMTWMAFWSTLYYAVQKRLGTVFGGLPALRPVPATLMLVSLAMAAAAGFIFYGNRGQLRESLVPTQHGTIQSGQILTTDHREVSIICKPGYVPPLCLAGEFDRKQDLSYQGNGAARPAVAKDTVPDDGHIHRASNLNDGMYGPGASWRSNSKNSWIKIDLGKATEVNTVAFGKDRLGKIKDGDPGQFVVSVALTDNVYANGNSSNDNKEYAPVYRSDQTGFSGTISGPETVTAQFDTHLARYIKITFENKGTTVDEVEAFMVEPPMASSSAGATHQNNSSGGNSASSAVAASPTNPPLTDTPIPADTATAIPTITLVLTDTATSVPTATNIPTSTSIPTSTLVPTVTLTSVSTSPPLPTDTPIPQPTNTPLPPPSTSTQVPTDPPTQSGMPTTSAYFNSLTQVPKKP